MAFHALTEENPDNFQGARAISLAHRFKKRAWASEEGGLEDRRRSERNGDAEFALHILAADHIKPETPSSTFAIDYMSNLTSSTPLSTAHRNHMPGTSRPHSVAPNWNSF
jgi:hypothetical protein